MAAVGKHNTGLYIALMQIWTTGGGIEKTEQFNVLSLVVEYEQIMGSKEG